MLHSYYKTFLVFLTFCVLVILNSCSIEKRLHQPGFYIKKKTSPIANVEKPTNHESNDLLLEGADIQVNSNNTENTSSDDKDKEEECDIIISVDGHEYEVIILEVDDESIRYKRCNNPDGPDFLMRKSKVFMIKYKNGDKDVFKENTKKENTSSSEPKKQSEAENECEIEGSSSGGVRPQQSTSKKLEPLAILSFFSAIASLFILGIVFSGIAVVTGVISISRIEKNENLGGLFFAILGFLAGLILFIFMLIFLLG